MADALVLGASTNQCKGSSPFARTTAWAEMLNKSKLKIYLTD